MAKCQPCLGQEIKDAIRDAGLGSAVEAILEKIPDCPRPTDIQVCGRVKRPASPRMVFMGECMKAGRGMKECSDAWKGQTN